LEKYIKMFYYAITTPEARSKIGLKSRLSGVVKLFSR